MATKVIMEALSPTMEEGRLVKWVKPEGATVANGDVLAEVETDKAIMELVARGDGVFRRQVVAEGATAPIGTLLGVIAGPAEDISALVGASPAAAPATPAAPGPAAPAPTTPAPAAPAGAAPAPAASAPAPTAAASAAAAAAASATPAPVAASAAKAAPPAPPQIAPSAAGAGEPSVDGGRIRSSPLARRLAAERGLDLHAIAGSGPNGRIIKRDVDEAIAAPEARVAAPSVAAPAAAASAAAAPAAAASAAASAAAAAAVSAAPVAAAAAVSAAPVPAMTADGYRDIPLSQIRRTIARRLAESIGPIPTFYLTAEYDVERLSEMRTAMAELGDEYKVSVNDIVLKAVATALSQHPEVNAQWLGDRIRQFSRVDLGMAVAIEDGLITPVLFDADKMRLRDLSREARELAGRARERRLKPEEYTGSTFSVSNLGMFGIDQFTAIINPPEAGILAIGSIEKKPVVVGETVVARRRMRVTMSCDHRVIDGATGAKFLSTLRRLIENPLMLVY